MKITIERTSEETKEGKLPGMQTFKDVKQFVVCGVRMEGGVIPRDFHEWEYYKASKLIGQLTEIQEEIREARDGKKAKLQTTPGRVLREYCVDANTLHACNRKNDLSHGDLCPGHDVESG